MAFRPFFIFSILVSLINVILPQAAEKTSSVACGLNQKLDYCGTACPETCEFKSVACVKMCVKGCTCLPGFVLTKDLNCIAKGKCPTNIKQAKTFNRRWLVNQTAMQMANEKEVSARKLKKPAGATSSRSGHRKCSTPPCTQD